MFKIFNGPHKNAPPLPSYILNVQSLKEKICFRFVNEIEIKKLIREPSSKRATGIETVLPRLIKVAVDFLTQLLTKSMNSSIEHTMFPDLAKTALVFPPDKGKSIKYDISNFQPRSILNRFSKFMRGL